MRRSTQIRIRKFIHCSEPRAVRIVSELGGI
jgi:hypothetical protein